MATDTYEPARLFEQVSIDPEIRMIDHNRHEAQPGVYLPLVMSMCSRSTKAKQQSIETK